MKSMKRRVMPAAAVLGLAVGATGPAAAGILFQEHFNTDTTDTASTLAAYSPPFSYSGGAGLYVSGGVLHAPSDGKLFYVAGFSGDITVNVDIGKTPGGGQSNTCLVIGDNRLVFHPGYSGGGFRVDGPGGSTNNTDMGFSPVANVLYEMTVSIAAASGHFGIEIVDPNNSANTFSTSFTNPGYTPGSNIGFYGYGYGGDTDLYANLVITNPSATPVPSTLVMSSILLGMFGVIWSYKRMKQTTAPV